MIDFHEYNFKERWLDWHAVMRQCSGAWPGHSASRPRSICRSPRPSALLPRIRATPKDMLLLANGFSCPRADRACTGRRAVRVAEVMA
jgi:hypothetical protein